MSLSPLGIHIANLGVHGARRRFDSFDLFAAALVLTGLGLVAYAWLAFDGLVPWWSQ